MSDDGFARLAEMVAVVTLTRAAVASTLEAQGCSAATVEREADRAASLALLMADDERCGQVEAARVLGVTERTVRRDLSRLRKALAA